MCQLCAQAQRSPTLTLQFSEASRARGGGVSKVRLSPRWPHVRQGGHSPSRGRSSALESLFMAPAGTGLDVSNPTREIKDPPSLLPRLTRALLSSRPFTVALLRRRLALGVPQIPASLAGSSPLVSVQTCITLSRLAGTAAKTEAWSFVEFLCLPGPA